MKKKHKIVVILGPTASGKSELAVKLAQKFKGEIISADSRQIYKGLDVGSGKVPRDKNPKFKTLNPKQIQNPKLKIQEQPYFYKEIEHHLIDVASPKRVFTVAQYQKLGEKTIKDIIKRGKIPIICGGTGLYIDSLIYGYQFPNVPPQPKLRKKLEKKSTEELFKQLEKLDPQRAKNIDKNNNRRLIRALEIILITGKPVPNLNKKSTTALNILKIGIKKSPEELKKKIRKRIEKMIKNGLIQEIKNLRKSGLSWKRIYELGFEYKYPAIFLQNKITKEKMSNKMISENIKYTKRQMTWFKRDKKIYWLKNKGEATGLLRQFLKKNKLMSKN